MIKNIFTVCLALIILTLSLPLNTCADITDSDIYVMYENALNEDDFTFDDLDSVPWAVLPVTELAKRGIVSGIGEGMFAPQKNVSRAEYIKLIVSVCGLIDKEAGSNYTDVAPENWAYTYVSNAKLLGLTDIYPENALSPDTPISREDICYMSLKALEHCVGKVSDRFDISDSFTDESEISSYALSSIYKLTKLGVISGRGNGVFSPKDPATRAESAKIIYNILKIIEENY